MNHEPLVTDLKFLVPLKYNSHAELSKGWNKARHLEWPTDGSYSRIPDEEFTLDATGDVFKSPRNTVKKDLSRLELYQLDSSEEHNVYPHSSFPLPRATYSQKNIVSKCKHFLTQTDSKLQCVHHANENDLLESLCKIYLRLSVNELNRNELVTSERDSRGKLAWSEAVHRVSPDQLGIGGAGMVAGNIALEDDPIQSFLSGILGNLWANSYAGKGRDVEMDRANEREVFGNLGIAGQGGVFGNVGVGGKANLYNDGNLVESTLVQMRGPKEGIGLSALGVRPPLQPSASSAGAGHRGVDEGGHAANVKLRIEVLSNDKYKESDELHDLVTAAKSDNHKKTVDVSPIRCSLEALLNPKQDGQIGDLALKVYNSGNVGDEPSNGCLPYRNLKTGLEATRAAPAPPPTVGRFRPLGGRRRADWVTLGGNGEDKRKPFLVL